MGDFPVRTGVTFATQAQRAAYEKVREYLRECFGELAVPHDDAPSFHLPSGSAVVTIHVREWRSAGESSLVDVYAWVVSGVRSSKELYEWLLRRNNVMNIGAFGLDEHGDVVFGCTMLGDTLDKEELRLATLAVAETADDHDDVIIERYGGQTAKQRERPPDMGPHGSA